jgi:hypothetical protein
MNFSFYIFGSPEGFDLLPNNTERERNYFQIFYGGNKENTKLTIHRMASGQVSYSYLRYNFITSAIRPNAFFGMSVVFNGEYCHDVEGLYELFDSVYKTILQNKILIEEIQGYPAVQARFLVRTFVEAGNEVKRIEKVVSKNLEHSFIDDIRPIDTSFIQGNSNSIKKLNDKKGNSAFLAALREYSWVSISPEYENDEIWLSLQALSELDNTIEKEQKNTTAIFINAMKGKDVQENIENSDKRIKDSKKTIQPYLKTQPELKYLNEKLDDIQKQLNEVKLALKNQFIEIDQSEKIKALGNEQYKKPNEDGGDDNDNIEKKDTYPKFPQEKPRNLWLIKNKNWISIACVIGIVGVELWFLRPHKNTQIPMNGTVVEYPKAQTNRGSSADNTKKIAVKDDRANEQTENAKQIAINQLREDAKTEFEKDNKRKKIDHYNRAKEILEKAKDYGGNLDSVIARYKDETIIFYTNLAKKEKNNARNKQCAGYILQLEPDNIFAKELLYEF